MQRILFFFIYSQQKEDLLQIFIYKHGKLIMLTMLTI